ncbi:MAG: DUF418 domain-containing protein [Dokdonia sp.]
MKSNQPISSKERILTLDILRGFAILGIFVVNIEVMNCLYFYSDDFDAQFTSTLDALIRRLLQLFFYSKFFPIFSLLFGVGIGIQYMSLQSKGLRLSFFIRRMMVLFLLGWAHILLLWSGDVLHIYAILGLFAIALVRLKSSTLVILALALLLFPFYKTLFQGLLDLIAIDPYQQIASLSSEEVGSIIRQGSYGEGVRFRWVEYVSNLELLLVVLMPTAAAMFLLGLGIVKKGWLSNLDYWVNSIKTPVLYIALLSNGYRIFFLFALWEMDIWKQPQWRDVFIYLMQIADAFMGLFYVWVIAYAMRFTFWKRLLHPLQFVGRMALTNYIGQSVIGLFLFTSVGFQKYQGFSPYQTLVIALLVFVFQILCSRLWLSYFRFGPLEWFWRCLSYWKWLPIRKSTS